MADVEMSELTDIFVHEEGNDLAAYYAGDPIARQQGMHREKFYADLHVWIRKNRYRRPLWRIDAQGQIRRDAETEERVKGAFESTEDADPTGSAGGGGR